MERHKYSICAQSWNSKLMMLLMQMYWYAFGGNGVTEQYIICMRISIKKRRDNSCLLSSYATFAHKHAQTVGEMRNGCQLVMYCTEIVHYSFWSQTSRLILTNEQSNKCYQTSSSHFVFCVRKSFNDNLKINHKFFRDCALLTSLVIFLKKE